MKTSLPKWRLNERKFARTGIKTYHKTRIPGTVRPSRLPGGSGFRNNWQEKEMRERS